MPWIYLLPIVYSIVVFGITFSSIVYVRSRIKKHKENKMFGLLDDIVTGVVKTVDDLIDNPIGKSVSMATQPLRDGLDIVDGLTEGELRVSAGLRLGADVVAGMATAELIEWYNEN